MRNLFVKILVSTAAVGIMSAISPGFAQNVVEETAPSVVTTEEEPGLSASVIAARSDPENWREVAPENLIVFETTKGRILIEAYPEIAPNHVAQFITIVRSGDYDGTPFHRVIDGFMAQGGDILSHHGRESGLPNIGAEFTFRRDPAVMKFDMLGDPDRSLQGYFKGLPVRTESAWLAELVKDGKVESYVPHCAGIVSTARLGDDTDSANSQFFLMRGHTETLDKLYTPWGRIVDGVEAPREMKTGDPQVVDPDILTSARMADDILPEQRPRVWVQRSDGPIYSSEIAVVEGEDVCDRDPVASIVQN